MTSAPHMIRDRKFHLRTYRRCMVGSEMTDWLLSQNTLMQTRQQAVGMWQVLLEEGVLVHGECVCVSVCVCVCGGGGWSIWNGRG